VLRTLSGGAVFGVAYFVLSQIVGFVYLLLATVFRWDVPGYHEPTEYEWWRWLLFSVWVAGFGVAVWWGASRFRSQPNPCRPAGQDANPQE
jgi:hypothetical protein